MDQVKDEFNADGWVIKCDGCPDSIKLAFPSLLAAIGEARQLGWQLETFRELCPRCFSERVNHMTPSEYVKLAVKTESVDVPRVGVNAVANSRILHGAIGLSTESGELLDAIKKNLFYGKPVDRVNIKEEIGDAMWYIAILCDALDVPLEEVMKINIAKLQARYPDKFTDQAALNRDLETERQILEHGPR